jgi:hypothetical protein
VHAYERYYLTIVKKNKPQMYEDLVDFFDDPDAEQEEWQYSKSVQKEHGRLEIRELWSRRILASREPVHYNRFVEIDGVSELRIRRPWFMTSS